MHTGSNSDLEPVCIYILFKSIKSCLHTMAVWYWPFASTLCRRSSTMYRTFMHTSGSGRPTNYCLAGNGNGGAFLVDLFVFIAGVCTARLVRRVILLRLALISLFASGCLCLYLCLPSPVPTSHLNSRVCIHSLYYVFGIVKYRFGYMRSGDVVNAMLCRQSSSTVTSVPLVNFPFEFAFAFR